MNNSDVKKLLGKQVRVQISGNKAYNGILTDIGTDVIVLYDGIKFLYFPLMHVHRIQLNINKEEHVFLSSDVEIAEEFGIISFNKVLSNAKGIFTEISVIGNDSYHGSIINVLSDYLVFFSPIYKILLIRLDHIKWFTPYSHNDTPYTLSKESLVFSHPNTLNLPSFEDQLIKEIGRLVVFDGGIDSSKIGLLKNVEKNLVELVIATGETVYILLNHIKLAQLT